MSYLRTAESVTEGHPDKIADQISDAVVDAILTKDKNARIACETLISNGFCVVAGEIRTDVYVPIGEIARNTIREIGYTDGSYGFDYRSAGVLMAVGEQSPDIAQGVDRADGKLGAGDQGIMVGYACDETPELMPLPIMLSHALTRRLAQVRKEGLLPFLCPDGKAQVVVRYEADKPVAIEHVTVSAHHSRSIAPDKLKEAIMEEVIKAALPAPLITPQTQYAINPTGLFVIGGPQADSGLTGRKNIVDSYGPVCPHGGGAFSGKDPSKVDRSGAYMARYIAKNLVAAGAARRATVELAYVIGQCDPVGVRVDSHGTGAVDDDRMTECIRSVFDLTPAGIIRELDLLKPQYRATAAYGHFGRENEGFGWERINRSPDVKAWLKI
ncbi:MAG: methionine adenosyltransferase [Campylobacterales bacterium]